MIMSSKSLQSDINKALEHAEAICRAKSVRLTDIRRQIFILICQEKGFVKAYDLLDRIKDSDYSAKPPTVYRALDFLLEHRLIHKLNSVNAFVSCTHPTDKHQCYFLICSQCHMIKECCDSSIEQMIQEISSESQFQPQHTTIEIEGLCQNCSNKIRYM